MRLSESPPTRAAPPFPLTDLTRLWRTGLVLSPAVHRGAAREGEPQESPPPPLALPHSARLLTHPEHAAEPSQPPHPACNATRSPASPHAPPPSAAQQVSRQRACAGAGEPAQRSRNRLAP